MGLDKLGFKTPELGKLKGWLQNAAKDRRLVRAAVILGMAGIVLIWLSSLSPREEPAAEAPESSSPQVTGSQYRQELEEDLCRIVRAVTGEQNPQVMITLEDSGSGVYAADSREGGGQRESSYVIIKDNGGSEHGLALEQRQPRVQGAVIVSRAAGDPAVRENLVNAARALLGVSAGRVCVVDGAE